MTTRRRFLTLLTTAALTLTLITTSSFVQGKGKPGGGKTPTLTVTLNPSSIEEGKSATATVTRSTSTGDVYVTLDSLDGTEALVFDPATATLKLTVTVPLIDGETTATFNVTGVDDGIADGDQTVTITASAEGYQPGSANLTVTEPPPVTYALHRFSMPDDYLIGNVQLGEINDVGEVVGYYYDQFVTGGEQPFYFNIASGNTVATNLNDLTFDAEYGVPEGWYIDAAQGINNWGEIAGALTKVGEPALLRGCIIELRPDLTDPTALPRLHLIPEPEEWTHSFCLRINDEGVVLGGDTYLQVSYVYHFGDTDIQIIPEPFAVWHGGRVHLTNPVNDGPSLVKVALDNEVLTYDVVSGTSIFTPQDDGIEGFNDYGHYCGFYDTGKGKNSTRNGYVFDGAFHSLNDMAYAKDLNNDGDVVGSYGGRAFLDHSVYGSISIDAIIVADEQEQSIWDASQQANQTQSERNATGFPVVSGTLRRGTTGAIFYDGYVLIPIE